MKRKLIVTTGNEINGRRIMGYLGIMRGIVVRSLGFGQRLSGGISALGGGNIREFEEVCEEARAEAYARMLDHAREHDADAIVAMRYDATEFAEGVTEVLAYGTAVKLEPLEQVLEVQRVSEPPAQ